MSKYTDAIRRVRDAAKQAAQHGNDYSQWSVEGDQVTREFSGRYTIAEIEALLVDMRAVEKEARLNRDEPTPLPNIPGETIQAYRARLQRGR